jgi:hypothetical protein
MIRRFFRAISAPARAIARHLLQDEIAKLDKRIVLLNEAAYDRIEQLEQQAADQLEVWRNTDDRLDEEVIKLREEEEAIYGKIGKLESKVEDFEMPSIDYCDLASELEYRELAREIDYTDLASWVDSSDLARELDDEDIALAMDTDAIASSLSSKITLSISVADE